jgi:AAA+ ATPase superfamily predicted ATPase
VPALDNPARTKRAVYRIVDPYFRFWFRFVAANRGQIARGLGAQIVDGRILPALDDYMGAAFEDVVRDHARGMAASGHVAADRVEAWWSADGRHEIDLVGLMGSADRAGSDEVTFVGTAKWSARPLGNEVLVNLDTHAAALPGVRPGIPRFIYGRAGCARGLSQQPLVRCFSADDLYH